MKYFITKAMVFLFFSVVIVYAFVLMPKFKNITISTGDSNITVSNFLTLGIFKNKAEFVSNVDDQVLKNAGTKDVILSFAGIEQSVTLNVIDDVAPVIKLHDLDAFLGYKIKSEDFIESIFDHSQYSISLDDSQVDYNNYGNYNVKVIVKDIYGNESSGVATLRLELLKESINHELGNKLSIEEFLINKGDAKKISSSNIDKIDIKTAGEYTFECTYNNKKYTSKVKIKDTKAPVINVQDITYKLSSKKKVTIDDLLVSVTDASQYKLTKTGNIDLTKLGEYKVTFKAEDIYGNSSSKVATLYVKKESTPPVIKGLKDITVSRGYEVNYTKGVSAYDAVDGKVDFTYDASKVNINKAGTYTVTYKAKDKSGNVATKTRKIIVKPTNDDTKKLLTEFYNKYLKGTSVKNMTKTIREKISYRHKKGDDPVYYGLSTMSGDCYVHAVILHKALDLAGIKNYLVENIHGTHYWVLAYEGGKWRHYDPTPGDHKLGPMTDKERAAKQRSVGAQEWDRSKYPKAE